MSPSIRPIDLKLDEWGSRLFNVSTETLPRPRRSTRLPLGSAKPVSAGGRLSKPRARATYVRQKLQAMVRRAPQVVVKLVRAPKGMKGISNNLTYISRDGQLEIEDQDGQVIHGKEAVADLKAEWRDGGDTDPRGLDDARCFSSRPLHMKHALDKPQIVGSLPSCTAY